MTDILIALTALVLLALVAYQVYSGGALKKVGIPRLFEIDFADKPITPLAPEVSRNFMIGRWQVEQAFGQFSGGTVVNYDPDGTLAGSQTMFVNNVGEKKPEAGRWNFEKLSRDTFRLKIQFADQSEWQGTFKIIDQDRIHNIDLNYVAVRMK